ncbi:hypothetical protein [Streptomyces sp. NPDC047453]|uniref:hypothetical protein n=1 Tax=Streptomyces sp. NPDC047453 TaxID=3154812 RepID=UPI0033E981EE
MANHDLQPQMQVSRLLGPHPWAGVRGLPRTAKQTTGPLSEWRFNAGQGHIRPIFGGYYGDPQSFHHLFLGVAALLMAAL